MVSQCDYSRTAHHRRAIQGLKHDLLADDTALRALIPQRLIAFDDAVRSTLKEEETGQLQRLGLRRSGLCPLATGVRLFCQTGGVYR